LAKSSSHPYFAVRGGDGAGAVPLPHRTALSEEEMSLDPLLHASPVIQIHAAFAIVALLLGAMQLFRKKGDAVHRAAGTVWVVLMAIVAFSGFFIWTIRLWGPFSPIHLLSIFVLVMLWRGVAAARRHDIDRHMKTMRGTYFFGLIITGLLTFIPGRTMYRVAFGPEGPTTAKLMVFATLVLVAAAAGVLLVRWRRSRQGAAFVASH
jgi:uncharacterized membrane protein